jgi:hypothetical protein
MIINVGIHTNYIYKLTNECIFNLKRIIFWYKREYVIIKQTTKFNSNNCHIRNMKNGNNKCLTELFSNYRSSIRLEFVAFVLLYKKCCLS